MRQCKADVLDGQSALQPLHLVMGLDIKYVIGQAAGIQVVGIGFDRQFVFLYQRMSVGVQERAVGLQVYQTAITQDVAIVVQKPGGGKSLVHLLHLRVRESDPYLGNLVGSKHTVDQLDARAQKRHVGQGQVGCHPRAGPHAGTLDVHPDVVLIGESLSQSHCILTLATSQFQHDGIIVVEVLLMPLAAHGASPLLHHDSKGVLEHALHALHVGKLLEFILTHASMLHLMAIL